jgi:hypothetical protein
VNWTNWLILSHILRYPKNFTYIYIYTFLKKREATFGGPHWRNHPKKLMFGGAVGKPPHNFGTGRSSQVTTQLFYNCKKVNFLAFVPLRTHQGFAAVNAVELTHMPRHRIQ